MGVQRGKNVIITNIREHTNHAQTKTAPKGRQHKWQTAVLETIARTQTNGTRLINMMTNPRITAAFGIN